MREGVTFSTAPGLVLAADTESITELDSVDNVIMVFIPGAMESGLSSWLFWGSLFLALGIAWIAAFPVNRWLIARGTGHAKLHAHHGH